MPQRIVSTNLCTDEYLFRLVPKNRIAALTWLAGESVSTIAGKVGGIALIRPDAETVLARHPDLVLLYQGADPQLTAQLQSAGVALFELPWASSLAQIRKDTALLAARLGARARGQAMLAALDRTLAQARAMAPHPPVRALIYQPNGYVNSSPLTGPLMAIAGLEDAAPALTRTRVGTVPLEAVLAAAPRLLILDEAPEDAPALADAPLTSPALQALKGRTTIVHAALNGLLCAGPWSAEAALRLARFGRLAASAPAR